MKLNVFSGKKKKAKDASIKATDFLNPRNVASDDLESEDKSAKKKETKVIKKELKRAEKKKELEVKEVERGDKIKKGEKEQNNKEDKKAKKELKELKEVKEEKKEINKEKEISQNNETTGHDFEKSNILEINLVKNEVNVYFDWYKNIAILIVFVFLSFILVVEVYLALSWWQSKNDSAVSHEEAGFIELSEETRKIRGEAEEALTFQTKLNRANYILDNHLYWSNFFDYLERNTLENIRYLRFEGDILGNFSIPAKSDNFSNLGQQVYQLQSDSNTINVNIDSAEKLESKEEVLEEIEFDINLQVSPDLFKK